MSEIAVLAGVCVKTLRRRLLPADDVALRHYWVQALDLKKRKTGVHGLVHGDTNLIRQHLSSIRGVDDSL